MKILVCGAGGAIGAAVVRLATQQGHEAHALMRTGTDVARLSPVADAVRIQHLDMTDTRGLAALVERIGPDSVVHAAKISNGSGILQPALLLQSASLTMSILDAVRTTGFTGTLVLFGSAMVYGAGAERRDQRTPLHPITFPGVLKALDSLLIGQAARQTDLTMTELRVFSAYGPFDHRERLVSRLLAAAVAGGTVDLTAEPKRRDFIHLSDVAEACLLACKATHRGAAVHNICTGRTRTNHEVAAILSDLVGRRLAGPGTYAAPDRYAIPDPLGMPSGPDEGFPWRYRCDLETGLSECLAWARTPKGRYFLGLG